MAYALNKCKLISLHFKKEFVLEIYNTWQQTTSAPYKLASFRYISCNDQFRIVLTVSLSESIKEKYSIGYFVFVL